MNISAIRTRVFKEGEALPGFVASHLKRVPEASVLVVSSKIVALSEKRTVPLTSEQAKSAYIRRESAWAVPGGPVWLTEKDGMLIPNAGIDESNGNGKLIFLPKDSWRAAAKLQRALKKRYRVRNLGIVIADSAITPLRAGTTGLALGYAGFKGVREYRGKKDLFGRTLRMSRTNVADSLATAAILLMGEGAERQPLALVANAPVEFRNKTKKKELRIPANEDLFGAVLKEARKKQKRR